MFLSGGVGGNLINSLIRNIVPGAGLGLGGYGPSGIGPSGSGGGCPLCDSSVYSYCSGKALHDACCCNGGGIA